MAPSSPRTPRHSRHTSTVSIPPSPYDHNDRRNSQASLNYPNSPNNRHSLARSDSIGNDVFSPAPGAGASNGLGNLADELADAWDDEEEDEEVDMNFQDAGKLEGGETRDSGVDVASSPVRKQENLVPPTSNGNGHRRKGSEYDGSDYGEDSDLDSPGALPPGLVARMDQVESLVRRGVENNGSERDGVVQRVIEGLKDLGSQSNVESGSTRLSTAHTALSTNLHHQTRLLQSLAHPLISPLAIPPPEEIVDDLLPLLSTLSESLPRPTTASLHSLTQLHALTADLIQTINYLSDTLHMSRQTTTTATRRLKSARELVAEMRREEEEREQGERWLERGNWGEKLQKRECAVVCRDVVGGFEKVCEGWRDRLVKQAEAVGAAS